MKLTIGIAVQIAAALAATASHSPQPAILFDFHAPIDRASIKTDGTTAIQVGLALRVRVSDPGDGAPSAFLLPEQGHWDFTQFRYLAVDVRNPGRRPVDVSVFAFVPGGFGGISTFPLDEDGHHLISPGRSQTLKIDLHQKFPDGTETINPGNVTQLRVILNGGLPGSMIDVKRVYAFGQGPAERHEFKGRLIVPPVTGSDVPAPGKRVYRKLDGSPVPYVLYLPTDWNPQGRFPIIAEYSGNILYFKNTYSTGKADQGNIGYGMSKGVGAIWVNLPFISPNHQHEQLNGFGDIDATAEYAIRVIRDLVENYAGDPGAVFLTGFSRGGAACGFIGLRDSRIADVWLAFHAVGGGDGAGWFGSDMSGALVRAKRIKGRSSFVTDGGPWQDVLASVKQPFIFMDSGIGAHVDTMFLDNRSSTVAARRWMRQVLADRPGVHDISGTVLNAEGKPVQGASLESGYTHFTFTDQDGKYTIRSLVNGPRNVKVSAAGMHFEGRSVTMAGKHVTGFDFQAVHQD